MSLKQMRFQVTSKLIRPNSSWITQTVRQRIANCWARNGESTSAESAATDAWNDELTATGGSQMLATRNRGDRHTVIGEVRRCTVILRYITCTGTLRLAGPRVLLRRSTASTHESMTVSDYCTHDVDHHPVSQRLIFD